ncbi:MAG: C4-type zinc ribbon domain-containing protein [Bacteroidota bacterium]|nr:C4-type zinc ribbon domain-containing protein [Bacteroidota bacterium]
MAKKQDKESAAAKEKASKTSAPKTTKKAGKGDENIEVSIEKKLITLYNLQQTDTQVDKIRIVRGELPLEVQDLEDEIAGLETRLENHKNEIETLKKQIAEKENTIKESQALIKKYEDQQMSVRNNREYDSLSKEIEFQTLEIQLSEKRIAEYKEKSEKIQDSLKASEENLKERQGDLDIKKNELKDIVAETEKEEKALIKNSRENQNYIEERLLAAYKRIRKNARNGLAVVKIERDACGGCFNKIPPQHQLDIRMHKKIIVCEYCGRILVDDNIAEAVEKL